MRAAVGTDHAAGGPQPRIPVAASQPPARLRLPFPHLILLKYYIRRREKIKRNREDVKDDGGWIGSPDTVRFDDTHGPRLRCQKGTIIKRGASSSRRIPGDPARRSRAGRRPFVFCSRCQPRRKLSRTLLPRPVNNRKDAGGGIPSPRGMGVGGDEVNLSRGRTRVPNSPGDKSPQFDLGCVNKGASFFFGSGAGRTNPSVRLESVVASSL